MSMIEMEERKGLSDVDERSYSENSFPGLSDETQSEETVSRDGLLVKITKTLGRWGLEVNGIDPVPPEERSDPRLYQIFFVWFSANANVLTMAAGTVGPAFYGLGIRDACLVIVVVDIMYAFRFDINLHDSCVLMRPGQFALVQSSGQSWGLDRWCKHASPGDYDVNSYYGAIIPSILNVISLQGYVILNTIIGGQTLGAISSHLSATLGIVIIGLFTLAVVFSGYRVLHWYETFVWIPNVIAFVVMLAVSGKHLVDAPLTSPSPVLASAVMTFGATLAATNVSYAPLTPDYGVYHDRKVSSWRIFLYAYLGFLMSSMPVHLLGAAFTATAYYVPTCIPRFFLAIVSTAIGLK
ncbi:predicted protein [Postia placenta Mad-698-R]|nr:predicted protein [Postia placenta Mad-698-R]